VAQALQARGIDVWLTSAGLQARIPALNGGVFPEQYRACSMTSDGAIVPATVWSLGSSEKVPAFDSMSPHAMDWLLARYKQIYLRPMAPLTSGYFFNEDCLYYAMDPGHANNARIDYWELPAYSDAVLTLWKQYCIDHRVTWDGAVVSRFPVHSLAMVPNGGGKTQYFPGWNVPAFLEAGTAVVSLPRDTGVWAAWDAFITSQYVGSWIGGISRAVYEVHQDDPSFQGVIYFALHNWSLAYEEITDPSFVVDSDQRWVPWGTQRGVRLSSICALPFVDYIICETFPPIRANLRGFAAEYRKIARENGKDFGLMLHRDDAWGLDGQDPETDRWDMIQEFQPTIIARYPIDLLFPASPYYDESKEQFFEAALAAYRH
jgi:hypothetical protein